MVLNINLKYLDFIFQEIGEIRGLELGVIEVKLKD